MSIGVLRITVEARWDLDDLDDLDYRPQVGEWFLLANDRYDESPSVMVVDVEEVPDIDAAARMT